MISAADLEDEVNWTGGHYELAIELGPADDDRLGQAAEALWAAAGVRDCFALVEGGHAPAVLAAATGPEGGHVRGTTRLPNGSDSVCGMVVLRDMDGVDWLDFYVPVGALERLDRSIGGFPFGDEGGPSSLAWRAPLDDWMAAMATDVFRAAGFVRAAIGFEAFGDEDAESGISPYFGVLVPDDGGVLRYRPAER